MSDLTDLEHTLRTASTQSVPHHAPCSSNVLELPDHERARRIGEFVGNVPTFSEPKSDAGRRSVPLAAQAVGALRAHRKAQAEERLAFADIYVGGDLVFAREDGSPVHPDRFLDAFHRITNAAGLRPTRPHDLRHGWASRALEAGVPAKVVQEILGHASAMVTLDIYSHVVPSMKSDATQLVADLLTTKR